MTTPDIPVLQFPEQEYGRLVATPSDELREHIEAFANAGALRKLGDTGVRLFSNYSEEVTDHSRLVLSDETAPAPLHQPDFYRTISANGKKSRRLYRRLGVANDPEYKYLQLELLVQPGDDMMRALSGTKFIDRQGALPFHTTFHREDLNSNLSVASARLANFVLGEDRDDLFPFKLEPAHNPQASVKQIEYLKRRGRPRQVSQ